MDIFNLFSKNYDTPSESQTLANYKSLKPQTGKERLYMMFSLDENMRISPEINSILQAGYLGFFIGVIYGGILHSRNSYVDFMENNQATAFKSHFDAKKKLQDKVTINFAKGGFRWGWRLALFSTSYVGVVSTISVYRGKSSIVEYVAAGGITGALFKMNLGLRGLAAGGTIGGVFGGIAGGVSLLIMNLTGTSMEEVRYWQYQWKESRDQHMNKAFQNNAMFPEDELMIAHSDKVKNETKDGKSLDNLNTNVNVNVNVK